jgi:hypothetical protein
MMIMPVFWNWKVGEIVENEHRKRVTRTHEIIVRGWLKMAAC